jgi:hypothetical protein
VPRSLDVPSTFEALDDPGQRRLTEMNGTGQRPDGTVAETLRRA